MCEVRDLRWAPGQKSQRVFEFSCHDENFGKELPTRTNKKESAATNVN